MHSDVVKLKKSITKYLEGIPCELILHKIGSKCEAILTVDLKNRGIDMWDVANKDMYLNKRNPNILIREKFINPNNIFQYLIIESDSNQIERNIDVLISKNSIDVYLDSIKTKSFASIHTDMYINRKYSVQVNYFLDKC